MSLIRMAVAGIALCAGASVASAQGGPPPGQAPQDGPQGEMRKMGRGGMQAKLFEGITLTADQQQKIDNIRASYRAQREKLTPNGAGGPPDDAARTKMKEAMEKQQAELRAVLTAEQQVIFDKNAAELKQRREQKKSPAKSTN